MRKRLTVIFIAFCISFVSMVALSLFSIGRFVTFTGYSNDVDQSNEVIRALYNTEVFFKDIDRWERGYILSNDSLQLKSISAATDSLMMSLDTLENILSVNPVQSRNMIDLKDNMSLRLHYLKENIKYIDTSHSRAASPFYYEGRKHMTVATRVLHDMHVTEQKLLNDRSGKQVFYQRLTTSTLKSLLIIFCTVTLFLFVLLIKLMRSGMLYQDELKAKVIDLKRSHSELQDIAYAISHDLQEPLRKIQVFSNMLTLRKNTDDADSKATLQRIHSSANRMQSLITDLVSLTNLTKTDENKSPTDLNTIAEYVLIDIQDKIKDKTAVVRVEQLPTIKCYETQIKILFRALIDNALKFVKEDVKPEIYISYIFTVGTELTDINEALATQEFHCIAFTDNGIGFDNKYMSNIFRIFRRLHSEQSQYDGKGIGLAICQRIMANHEGYILGEGIPDGGATFKLFFPA